MSLRLTGLTRAAHPPRSGSSRAAARTARGQRRRPVRPRPDPGLRDRQAVGGVRRAVPGLRRGPGHRPPARPAVSVPRPDHGDRGGAWKMAAGGEVEAEYDVPPDAWYFAADRQADAVRGAAGGRPPALRLAGGLHGLGPDQRRSTCHFRNLGGRPSQLGPVTPDAGTLTTAVRITKVVQLRRHDHPALRLRGPRRRAAGLSGRHLFRLLPQAGAGRSGRHPRGAPRTDPARTRLARARRFGYPAEAPFPDERLRMIDRVDGFVPDGGPHGLGLHRGDARRSTRAPGSSRPTSIRTRSGPGRWGWNRSCNC